MSKFNLFFFLIFKYNSLLNITAFEWNYRASKLIRACVSVLLQTIKCNLHKHNSVLVTDGVNALGQAVISICLAIGCPIYTTVTNIEEKVFLMKLFPELQGMKYQLLCVY